MRGVASVEHERVPVRVVEDCHVADAGVERLGDELDALRLQRALRRLDVGDAERDRRGVRALERPTDVRRVDEVEGDVLAELVLGPALVPRDLRQTERLAVEPLRAPEIGDRDRDEIRPLDGDHDPSRGLYRWWSMSAFPSGSWKKAMWHTPVSNVSPSNSTPRPSSSARAASMSSTWSARCAVVCGANSMPN